MRLLLGKGREEHQVGEGCDPGQRARPGVAYESSFLCCPGTLGYMPVGEQIKRILVKREVDVLEANN